MPILPIDSGRYGTIEMKKIFEEEEKLNYELKFESEVSSAQAKLKIIPLEAARDIENVITSKKITIDRIKELEKVSDHDTAALIEAISELCHDKTKPWVHYGLTSNDVVDSSTSMQLRDSFHIIEKKMNSLITMLLKKSLEYQNLPAVGRTHGQHASIISFGLKFAVWCNELLDHMTRIQEGKKRFLLCKTLGVVGTGSLMREKALDVQRIVSEKLELFPTEAATQVIPRERYSEMIFIITLIGSTLDKIAIEIRNLQRTEIGEIQESFKVGQMGSSAVPVKKNPIKSERISSLYRIIKSNLYVSLDNVSLWHERDLSNSANERFIIPISLIIIDEMLDTMIRIISNMFVNKKRILENLDITNGQIYAEFVLQLLILKGVPRFKAYRIIQNIAFQAVENSEHFYDALLKDENVTTFIKEKELRDLFNPNNQLSASKSIIQNLLHKAKSMNIVPNEL